MAPGGGGGDSPSEAGSEQQKLQGWDHAMPALTYQICYAICWTTLVVFMWALRPFASLSRQSDGVWKVGKATVWTQLADHTLVWLSRTVSHVHHPSGTQKCMAGSAAIGATPRVAYQYHQASSRHARLCVSH